MTINSEELGKLKAIEQALKVKVESAIHHANMELGAGIRVSTVEFNANLIEKEKLEPGIHIEFGMKNP